MFNLFVKKQKKDYQKHQERIKNLSNKILDLLQNERVSKEEMSDVLINLQDNFQKSLIHENDK